MRKQNGFSLIELVLAVVVLAGIGTAVYFAVLRANNAGANPLSTISPLFGSPIPHADVRWNIDSQGGWIVVAGKAPECPAQPMLKSPADIADATSVLYPGQNRGGNYKPHGGLRFDTAETNSVVVTAPMDGYVYRGSRYLENGQLQYMFDIINPCGIMVRFDHLQAVEPKLEDLADSFPAAAEGASQTTLVNEYVVLRAGEKLATKVGFNKGTPNTGFDFGVYDLRKANAQSTRSGYVATYGKELAGHAVCWLDGWLPAADQATLTKLPAGDYLAGKRSDYCL